MSSIQGVPVPGMNRPSIYGIEICMVATPCRLKPILYQPEHPDYLAAASSYYVLRLVYHLGVFTRALEIEHLCACSYDAFEGQTFPVQVTSKVMLLQHCRAQPRK